MNSSDNSTDSSEGSPLNHMEGPNIETEKMLPSVLIATEQKNIDFFLSLCDFAILRGFPQLRDSVRNLLKLLPTGTRMLGEMLDHCRDCSQRDSVSAFNSLRSYFVAPTPSPSRTLYLLEISHAMLMPSVDFRDSESVDFQVNFVVCGGLKLLLSFLTDKTLLADAGNVMKRSAMMTIMKMLKLLLMASAYGCIVHVVQDMKNKQVSDERHKAAMVLQTALQNIIPVNEQKLRHTASMLARQYWEKLISPLPDVSVVRSIQLLAWSAACGDVSLSSEPTSIHNAFTMLSSSPSSRGVDTEDMHLARDSLEVLSLSLAISPHVLTSLETSQDWKHFVIDTLLLIRNRLIRITAADQLFYIVTKCSFSTSSFISFISLLFSGVESVAKDHAPTSGEFFRLLARLLNHAHQASVQIAGLDKLLEEELKWLLKVREDTLASPTRQCPVEGPLLDGHLSLLVELLTFRSVAERHHIGSKSGGERLIEIVMSDFLFPASRLVKEARENPDSEKQELSEYVAQPICSTTECTQSAFKLLNALCAGCSENIATLHQLLSSYFYSGQDPPLCEWEFIPHIGPRPLKGFVGLKNAGATCYMNSVLQQLYTIPPIRVGILAVEEAAKEFVVLDEQEREGEKKERKQRERLNNIDDVEDESEGQALQSVPSSSSDDRKDTQKKVLMQLQSIFSHLLEGRLQFHTPQGFWREFRLWGDRVNLREQHDAFEFFNCLVDNLDEGLKTFSYSPVLSEVLGGAFADQKICRGCPHRYSREESFTALNIDIRNQQHLFESLDAFVKGDLLEGANAYHCEKCDKKVDTVKRLCISRLPKVLVIQLKRFDYDWERETAVKFNDYFEFPRELDMSPYTAATLAKTEGEEIPSPEETEQKIPGDKPETPVSTHYHLRGIVVHSGQASGGHYYSFIRVRPQGSGSPKWFRFDDGEVVEAKIDDEEEFKAQCFGGDYTGEVYDHVLKKTHYRRQKRWWSAYLLFYDRADQCPVFDEALQSPTAIPKPMKSIVHKQNLEFLHHKSHYSFPYFQFMKNFLILNGNHIKAVLERNPHMTLEMEKLGLQCVQLATTFLFHCGIHTKKTLRGPAAEWYDALQPFLLLGPTIRLWFADNVFLKNRDRFSEYLLECPSAEVRNMFSKMITFLCVATNKDPPIEVSVTTNAGTEKTRHLFSEIALNSLLQLLKKQVADNSRHLNQYFQVFLNYANRGVAERKQLLHLSVPSLFIAVALDEGPGPPLRSPYADLSKLYAVVGILVRSCDVTMMQKSLYEGQEPLPNEFADPELSHPLPNDLHNWLYERINTQQNITFTKKMIEDNSTMDETIQFLCFVCWEHWQFSMIVLNDLLLEIAAVQVFDMRPFLDLLSHLLMLQDTWQGHRISTALKGFTHHADGLITIIQHGQTHFHKRAYLCIKFLVALCGRCPLLYKVISEDLYIKTHWQSAIRWLHTEMERRPYVTPGYSYTGWSPPAQSNEASNGYYLERSNSAKLTLKRAKELFPMEEPPEEHVEEVIPPGGDPDAGMPAEEAEIHGIERHPVPHTQQPHSNTSTQCPPSDSVPNNDPPTTEQHPQPIPPSNEQGTTTVKHGGSLTDGVDRIHEETLVGNKNDTSLPEFVPDPA
ncbi:Probable ubiquitin carboxyl-terminal hydrolase FAF-X [Geodia barretti]|nr:Probable ubiquitin carboxyl-terminal hydrolase FAF-X [Geodia barretti]